MLQDKRALAIRSQCGRAESFFCSSRTAVEYFDEQIVGVLGKVMAWALVVLGERGDRAVGTVLW